MYRVLIIEDDPAAAEALRGHLARYESERDVVLSVSTSSTADPLTRQGFDFDLVFLDIDLPGMDGMEAATLLRCFDEVTPIIFVTNLASYAVRGYEVNALDFIVKPVAYHHFSMRMDKALRVLRRNAERTIRVNARGGMLAFSQDDLVYVEVVKHDLVYHVTAAVDGSDLPRARGSLRRLEEELAGGPFLRISSGCLVNMNHVRLSRPGMMRVSTGETLYVSRKNRRNVLDTLANYLGGSI